MPLLRLETSASVPDETRDALLASLSRLLSDGIGKSEQYVMVTLQPGSMRMGGEAGAAAFVDVRSIGGLDRDVNRTLSEGICALLHRELGISPDRIYLNFTDTAATHWGWNGRTFG